MTDEQVTHIIQAIQILTKETDVEGEEIIELLTGSCWDEEDGYRIKQQQATMTTQNKSSRTFSLGFVENINKSLSMSKRSNRRARNRSAVIRSLMIINKSDLEIQRDLQTAFEKVTRPSTEEDN